MLIILLIGVPIVLFLFCLCKISTKCDKWEEEYEKRKNL